MCINISMSIIEKVFKCEETELSVTVIKCEDDIWFRGKMIAEILGYAIQHKAILDHVDPEDKRELSELGYNSRGAQNRPPFKNEMDPLKYRGSKTEPLTNSQKNAIYINESRLYSLILRSKLESACAFKRWVMSQVLPSIRKTGRFDYCINHKYNNMLTFKIEKETDLHINVVSFLKKRYLHSLFTVTLGENQNTSIKRIESYRKGYLHGSPDLIINNLHKHYTGFAIKFKSPKGFTNITLDLQSSLKVQKEMTFCHLISL